LRVHKSDNSNPERLHEGELWRQAVASALIAKDLAEKKGIGQKKHILFIYKGGL